MSFSTAARSPRKFCCRKFHCGPTISETCVLISMRPLHDKKATVEQSGLPGAQWDTLAQQQAWLASGRALM